jgi:hypothetical protein
MNNEPKVGEIWRAGEAGHWEYYQITEIGEGQICNGDWIGTNTGLVEVPESSPITVRQFEVGDPYWEKVDRLVFTTELEYTVVDERVPCYCGARALTHDYLCLTCREG